MTRLQLFEPGFTSPFESTFRRFFSPARFEMDIQPLDMRLDVSEKEHAYIVKADIPGVKKEDINVTINGNQVEISAEIKREREDRQGEKVLRSERYYGKVYRAFSLAQDVDEASAQAKYNEGVLELRLPKKAAVTSKKLAIQ